MVLSSKLAEEVPWYNFLWEKGSKDSFMFFTFSCKYKLFFVFLFFGGRGGGLVCMGHIMLCSEKEDFIWLYFNQNACAKFHHQFQGSKLPELLIGQKLPLKPVIHPTCLG